MKNSLVVVLALAACLVLGDEVKDASGDCGKSVKWYFTAADHTLTINGTGDCDKFVFTNSTPWYNYSSEIYHFVVENGVTGIPSSSVSAYHSLKSAVIADSVTTAVSFQNCDNVETIKLSSSMTALGSYNGCLKLKSLEIPPGVTSIGTRCFYNCRSLKSVVIPKGVTEIWDYSFYNCTSLETLDLPPYLDWIYESAFRHCKSLKSVVMPVNCSVIEATAFGNCIKLERIIIPETVRVVYDKAFTGCKSLISVIYRGTTRIAGTHPFDFCDNLDVVCVPLDYNGTEFGDKTVYKSDSCDKIVALTNKCYGLTVEEGVISTWKRKEADEWENRTDDCAVYQCSNESGFVSWGMCNSSTGNTKMCIDKTCTKEDPLMQGYPVVIELKDPVDASAVNVTETLTLIQAVSGTTGKWNIGLQTDSQGRVVDIIVFADGGEDKAVKIASAVNNIKKGDDCQYGILCQSMSAHVYSEPISLSSVKSSSHQASSIKSSSHQTSSVKSASSHPQSLPQSQAGAAISEHNSNIVIVAATAMVIAFVSLF